MSNPMNDGKEAVAVSYSEGHLQYLTFMLQRETFAVAILNIKEIIEYGHLTTVPMMPDFIRGVINLRGSVVPVVDLRARFEGKKSDITRRTCIVIVEMTAAEHERLVVGVVVDAVNEVLEIPDSEIELLPAIDGNIRADFIQGMGKVNGRFVIILDVAKIFSIEEFSLLKQDKKSVDMEAA